MADRPLTTRDLTEAHAETTGPESAADEPLGRDPAKIYDSEGGGNDRGEPLLPPDESKSFTSRWQEFQAGFVDEPRESVEQADALVADRASPAGRRVAT